MKDLEQLAIDVTAMRIELLEEMREAVAIQDKNSAEYYSDRLQTLFKCAGATLALLEDLTKVLRDRLAE